jgi:PAS domain S-box-containing protein
MQAGRATRAIARFGGVGVALLVIAALGVILASFQVQQHERIEMARDEQRGLDSARPVARMLDRLVRARLLSAQASAGDPGAGFRYAVARRSALEAFHEARELQRRTGDRFDTADDFAALDRKLAILLPPKAGGGMDAQRAFGSLTAETVRLLGRIGDGSRLILDAEPETYALIDATVVQLPAVADAGGGALALRYLPGQRARRPVDLAVAKGTVESSLTRLQETLGQRGRVAVDDAAMRDLRAPVRELTWGMTSLMADLTAPETRGRRLQQRSATAPLAAYVVWKKVADHLDAHLDARVEGLERRDRLVKGAGALLLLLGLVVFAAHRRQRRRLRETQARYRTLVEQLPAVTYVLEGDHVVYASPQLAVLLGRDAGDWLDSVHEDDRTAVESARRAARAGVTRSEYRIHAADGRVVWVRDEAAPVLDGGVQGVLLDVTDRRQAEEERDRMELELQVASKLEAVGQLAAGVAHEINTPIQFVGDSVRFLDGAVVDLLELVELYRSELARAGDAVDRDRIAEGEEAADLEYLQERIPAAFGRTFEGVERVSTIVAAMKRFSHTTGGDMAPADLNEAIQTTLVVCANEYKYVARLETDLSDLPPVVCHIGDLNQVVLNLVVNAAHAIEDASGDEPGTIAVRTAHDGEDAVITVSDTGCGIPDAVRERIFEPFFTTKDVGRGSGQGLALARSIVTDGHGGSIEVETAAGAGTTFVVRVPVAGKPAPVPV